MDSFGRINQIYVRLLNYKEAELIIEHINQKDWKIQYANITQGGVSICSKEDLTKEVTEFLTEIGARFELTNEHPMAVEKQIVENFRNIGIIDKENHERKE